MVCNEGNIFCPEADLLFVDMDIDTKPEDIKFESRATPNGDSSSSSPPPPPPLFLLLPFSYSLLLPPSTS